MATLERQIESELLALAREDDRDAFSRLYNAYWPELYSAAYKRSRDREQCEDVIQNVFADLWLRRHVLNIDNLGAYLHTAVRLQLYKAAARKPAQAFHLDAFEELILSPVSADAPLREKEITELIRLWLEALPEKRRQIFLMHYTDELSTREIADQLNISQNTVQSQLFRANESLRSRLAQFLMIAVIMDTLHK